MIFQISNAIAAGWRHDINWLLRYMTRRWRWWWWECRTARQHHRAHVQQSIPNNNSNNGVESSLIMTMATARIHIRPLPYVKAADTQPPTHYYLVKRWDQYLFCWTVPLWSCPMTPSNDTLLIVSHHSLCYRLYTQHPTNNWAASPPPPFTNPIIANIPLFATGSTFILTNRCLPTHYAIISPTPSVRRVQQKM